MGAGCGKPHVRWCGRDSGRNPVISTRSFIHLTGYFQYLVDNGKKPLQAVCAIMRKQFHAIHGMLKNNEPFDNTWFYGIPLSTE
jgi:hypothetical protein